MNPYEENKYYYELAEKWKNGTITPEEEKAFAAWYVTGQSDPVYLPSSFVKDEETHQQRMVTGVHQKTGISHTPVRRPIWGRYAAAVVALLIAVGGAAVFLGPENWWQDVLTPTHTVLIVDDVSPGSNRAVLTLADGRRIDLSEEQAGIAVKGDIRYLDGSVLSEEIDVADLPVSAFNILSTPRGGQYRITLPDGTDVWLNAASSLRYPSDFSDDGRVVELDGEAYFEVAQIRKKSDALNQSESASLPFLVKTRGQIVEVLGTQFNISAYADDAEIKTTLVEGKVQLTPLADSHGNRQGVILKPGEQAINSADDIRIRQVNTQDYTVWKEGRFSFEDKSFEQVMKDLARWYDLKIIYEGAVPEIEFYGDAFRNNNLSIVLEILKSAELKYHLKDRTLTIINNRKEATSERQK